MIDVGFAECVKNSQTTLRFKRIWLIKSREYESRENEIYREEGSLVRLFQSFFLTANLNLTFQQASFRLESPNHLDYFKPFTPRTKGGCTFQAGSSPQHVLENVASKLKGPNHLIA
jgi:hypothetical protein